MKKGEGQTSAASASGPDINWEAVVRHSPDAILVADRSGRIKFANAAAVRICGYNVEETPTIQEHIRRATPDRDAQRQAIELWEQDANDKNPPARLFPRIAKDGRQIWCRFQMAALPTGDRVVSFQDVTASKLIEDRYRTLFEQASDIVLLADAETGAFVDFNTRACETLGYSPDELRRLTIAGIEASESPSEAKRHILEIVRRGSDSFETSLRRKNGDLLRARVTVKTLAIGTKQFLQSTIHDITEENRAQLALKESEEKFRNLAEQSPNMIFINVKGRVVYANSRCEEVMGHTVAELCSPDFDFMSLVAPEQHGSTREYFRIHMSGKDVPPSQYAIVTKEGIRIPAVISTRLINYQGQRAILGIVTDISELKRAETSLREAAAKLREQKKALEEKNAALKEILSQIETEKLEIRRQVTANAEKFLVPTLHKMKRRAGPLEKRYLDVLETSIRDMTSKFGARLGGGGALSLSAREMEVCNMIRSGLSSKEIAQMLQISLRTVDTYRNRIRKKFGITNSDVNLFAHLQALR